MCNHPFVCGDIDVHLRVQRTGRVMRAIKLNLRYAACAAIAVMMFAATPASAQAAGAQGSLAQTQRGGVHRTRLILKSGTYQLVLSYEVVGDVVRYRSAERDGQTEEIPLDLVDLPATERWKAEHGGESSASHPLLDPELEKEEAARRALTPEVAHDLRLPEEDSVLALDSFHGTDELAPLPQEGSDLNSETAHAEQKVEINPASVAHLILTISGPASDLQLHFASPVFFVRIGAEQDDEINPGSFTVDTHGAPSRATPSGGEAKSTYVIERLDVRQDERIVSSFRIRWLGTGRSQPDIIETQEQILAGGSWMKLTPEHPLEPGEYALIEVLSGHEVNLNVWDFGVHADAKANPEAIRPEAERPASLQRRAPQ
jgi:hypothetical protein